MTVLRRSIRSIRLDSAVIDAVNQHQRGDKGFGPALGPAAAAAAPGRFEAVGYTVVQGASDWVFGPKDTEIQTEVLTGWAVAAREIGSILDRRHHQLAGAPARSYRGRPLIHAGRSRGFLRPADRDALSRQVAVEQHFLADQMRPHRRAQRLVGAVDRLERDAGLAGTRA